MNYNDFKFLSFDCYGTLIDWESGIWNAFQPLIHFNKRDDLTREKVLRNFALLIRRNLNALKYYSHKNKLKL